MTLYSREVRKNYWAFVGFSGLKIFLI